MKSLNVIEGAAAKQIGRTARRGEAPKDLGSPSLRAGKVFSGPKRLFPAGEQDLKVFNGGKENGSVQGTAARACLGFCPRRAPRHRN